MRREGLLLRTKILPEDQGSNLSLVVAKLEDPEFNAHEINRLILIEIAKIAKEVARGVNGDDPREQLRFSRERLKVIKLLRELGKQVREASLARNREDRLNLDGPKFQFVFKEMMELFQLALKNAGIRSDLVHNVMLHYRDIVVENDERIRRELKQMDSRPS